MWTLLALVSGNSRILKKNCYTKQEHLYPFSKTLHVPVLILAISLKMLHTKND